MPVLGGIEQIDRRRQKRGVILHTLGFARLPDPARRELRLFANRFAAQRQGKGARLAERAEIRQKHADDHALALLGKTGKGLVGLRPQRARIFHRIDHGGNLRRARRAVAVDVAQAQEHILDRAHGVQRVLAAARREAFQPRAVNVREVEADRHRVTLAMLHGVRLVGVVKARLQLQIARGAPGAVGGAHADQLVAGPRNAPAALAALGDQFALEVDVGLVAEIVPAVQAADPIHAKNAHALRRPRPAGADEDLDVVDPVDRIGRGEQVLIHLIRLKRRPVVQHGGVRAVPVPFVKERVPVLLLRTDGVRRRAGLFQGIGMGKQQDAVQLGRASRRAVIGDDEELDLLLISGRYAGRDLQHILVVRRTGARRQIQRAQQQNRRDGEKPDPPPDGLIVVVCLIQNGMSHSIHPTRQDAVMLSR